MSRAELVGGGLLDGITFSIDFADEAPPNIYVPVEDSGAFKFIESQDEYASWPRKAAFEFSGRTNSEGLLIYFFKEYITV